jgi:RepB DNA-primase from phage plasmid
MTSAIPQLTALRLQLAMIAGGEPAASFFELRYRKTRGMGQRFRPLPDVESTIAEIERLALSTDVYLACAPRIRQDGTAGAVERVWCLWADCDDAVAVDRLSAFQPQANIIARSGSGDNVHAYWQLQNPLSPAWARRANLRLALALGADRAATDAARILRPAGTLNHKHDPPAEVVCTRLELDVQSFDQIVGGLADDPAYAPKPLASPRRAANPSKLLEGLVRTIEQAGCGNRNRAAYWAACRAAEHGLDLQAAGDALREAALAAGLAEFEVQRTIRSGFETAARSAA